MGLRDGALSGLVMVILAGGPLGAQVDLANNFGRTSLLIAAKRNHVAIVSLLLERGANPNHLDIQDDNAMDLT